MGLILKLAQVSLKYFSLLCSFSVNFRWDEEGDIFFEKRSGLPLLVWCFQQLCTFSTVPVYAVNLHQTWETRVRNREFSQLIMNVFFLVVFPFAYCLQYMFFQHRGEMIKLVNETIELARHFEEEYVSNNKYSRDRKLRQMLLGLLGVSYIFQIGILNMGLFSLHPREGRYLSSYLLTPYYDHPETKTGAFILGLLFEFWFLSTQWAGITLQVYINILYLQNMSTSLNGLRSVMGSAVANVKQGQSKTKAMLRIFRAYKKLELLSSMYNETLGQRFLSRFKSSMAVSTVSSAFILVKTMPLNDVIITGLATGCMILFVGMFTILTTYCSRVHEESRKLRAYLLRQRMPGEVIKREMKCYKVIGVKIGNFFIVKRNTPLTMLAMISNTAMSTLISVNFNV